MTIGPTELRSFLRDLEAGTPFSFSRWGDGEWRSVLGTVGGANCDGHHFYPEMGQELRQVLRSRPPYLLGMQRHALRLYGARIESWVRENLPDRTDWLDADVFHTAARRGELGRLLDVLRERKVLMVGPAHLDALRKRPAGTRLNFWRRIDVPPRNAFLVRKRIVQDALALADKERNSLVVAISAGMPAEIVLDALYKHVGARHTLIDFGSLWDQLCGVPSRSYQRGPGYRPFHKGEAK